MQLIRTGKVKEVFDDGNRLVFKFTDKISVFDKIIPTLIEGKGQSLCRTSAFWFKTVADLGFETHFLSAETPTQMTVRKFRIIESGASKFEIDYLIPLEFVTRYYAAGSLMDRIKNGSLDYHSLGFSNLPKYGEEIPDPFFEVTTKFEKFDRPLSIEEACDIGGVTREELLTIRDEIFSIDRKMQRVVGTRGLIHADGKKEFGLGYRRNPVIVDTFGTADEDRFWEKKDMDSGKIVELSKEFVRQHYRETGYHSQLYAAREKGEKEPEIPALPDALKKETESLYRNMFERLTGEKW